MWLGGCCIKVQRGPTRGAATDTTTRVSVLRLSFFFFFLGFMPTRLRFAPIQADLRRIGLIRPKLGRIIQIRLYRPMIETAEISLESCRNSRNRLRIRPKHPKSVLPQFYSEYLLLFLCFPFCFVFLAFFFLCFVNQGHSDVFFKNILIVKIYRKYR